MTASTPSNHAWSNWAGNQRATAVRVARPTITDEVAATHPGAAADGLTVKPIGAGHSFTAAAVTDGVRLRTGRAGRACVSIDRERKQVTVQAGMQLHALNEILAANGLAMPNLGDIDVQTVSGAISTGTHGTGAKLGCLSTFVVGLTHRHRDRRDHHLLGRPSNPDVFDAARVGVGALGVITEVTLQCHATRSRCGPTSVRRTLHDVFGRPGRAHRRATTTSRCTGSRTPTGSRSSATTGCRSPTGR